MAEQRGVLRPLGQRDFALLWAGQTVSLVGDGIFTVALPLQTLALTPRPTALATVIAARALYPSSSRGPGSLAAPIRS